MAPQLVALDAHVASKEAILEVLDRDGAVIVHNMLSSQVLSTLRSELRDSQKQHQPGTHSAHPDIADFWGSNTIRFTRLAARSQAFAEHVLVHPTLTGVADAVLLPHCAQYWVNTGQMMVIGPGQKAQGLHRDAENWSGLCESPKSPDVTVSCMFAVSDFLEETGATRVVPGSHKWTDYGRVAQDHEVCSAVMPAGSGLIYSGKVIHGGGQNSTTASWREGLHLSYVLGWLTPEEALCVGVPPERARAMTPQQQRLLGYRCYDDSANNAVRLWTVDYEDIPTALGWEGGKAKVPDSGGGLKLVGNASFRSFRNLWMLEELGVPYTHVPAMPLSKKAKASSPFGKVPSLVDGDFIMYESAAINTYLGDKFRGTLSHADLVPPAGSTARARYDQLVQTIMTELDSQGLWIHRKHAAMAQYFGDIPAAVEHAKAQSERAILVLADELSKSGGDYLLGPKFSAADILLVHCLKWAKSIGWASWEEKGSEASNLIQYMSRCCARDAHKRVNELAKAESKLMKDRARKSKL